MFVVCTVKEQIIATLHPRCRACREEWSSRSHHRLTASRRGTCRRCQSGTARAPAAGGPRSVTRAPSERWAGSSRLQPRRGRSRGACRASPLLNPRPHCPQHKGGNRKRLSQEISQHTLGVVLHRPIDHDLGVSHPRNKVSPLLLVLSLLIIPKQLAGIAEHQQLHTATPASTCTSSGGPGHRSPA